VDQPLHNSLPMSARALCHIQVISMHDFTYIRRREFFSSKSCVLELVSPLAIHKKRQKSLILGFEARAAKRTRGEALSPHVPPCKRQLATLRMKLRHDYGGGDERDVTASTESEQGARRQLTTSHVSTTVGAFEHALSKVYSYDVTSGEISPTHNPGTALLAL
jgi:hypothetical protein